MCFNHAKLEWYLTISRQIPKEGFRSCHSVLLSVQNIVGVSSMKSRPESCAQSERTD